MRCDASVGSLLPLLFRLAWEPELGTGQELGGSFPSNLDTFFAEERGPHSDSIFHIEGNFLQKYLQVKRDLSSQLSNCVFSAGEVSVQDVDVSFQCEKHPRISGPVADVH